MARLKLDSHCLDLSSFMEKVTGARVKDCFKDEETIFFIVDSNQMGKALGRGGVNIKRAQANLGKLVRIIEFRPDPIDFVRNIVYPLKVEQVTLEDGVVYLKDSRRKTKSLLIGRQARNLALINRAIKRFFDLEVKIL